ncbi:PBAN-type neuropeptides-like [Anopheles ziemanni]|uniref:PBAN-type neuropeptides-like n=1 Tax=Anopheles coustani TaxID=139045 RepID=UPI00265AFBB6|nr:PBAN-type neuropeptides-like [Anopheles coustani]XP_058173531.1 PBAN-type neuropeptides-like [Anopheles ziemanni]
MFRFYFFFNLICLYLAIKSALSVEMDANDQKFAHEVTDGAAETDGLRREDGDDGINKRAAAMWFGPRLGKRTIPVDLHDELMEEFDSEPLGYAGESPEKLATELIEGTPYVVLLLTARPRKPQPIFYHTTSPRLGRRDSVGENHQRPPFAPRLGRNLPFSPRLGRSYNGGYPPLPFQLPY